MSDRAILILVMSIMCATAHADDPTAPLVREEFTPAEERVWNGREAEWTSANAAPGALDVSDAALAAYAKTCKSRLGGETRAEATSVRMETADKKTAWELRGLRATVVGKCEIVRLDAPSPRIALDVFGAADLGPLRPDVVEVRGRQLVLIRGLDAPLPHADYCNVLEVAWVAQSPRGWQAWSASAVYLPSGGFARTSESLGPAAWFAHDAQRACEQNKTLEQVAPDHWKGRLGDTFVERRSEPDDRLTNGFQLARGASAEEVARLWALLEWRYGAPERPRQDPEALPELFPIEPLRRAVQMDLRNIAVGSNMFKIDVGRTITSLRELEVAPEGAPRWNGPYVRGALVDPWRRDYRLECLDDGVLRLFSLGADGEVGGTDRATDIELVHPPR
jgi:hypothetical protein